MMAAGASVWRDLVCSLRCLVPVALFIHAPAGARDLSCPETIETQQSIAGNAPASWRAAIDKAAGAPVSHWDGVAFSDGPPENLASLAPDDSEARGGNRVDIYKFPASVFKQIWLSCSYAQTAVILTRNPGLIGSVCRVTFDGTGDDAGPIRIVCSP